MNAVPEPLYVKNCDLPSRPVNEMAVDLCELCTHVTPGQIIGAEMYREIWSIYLKTTEARDKLIDAKVLKRNNYCIELHSTYPTSKNIPNEKIVFRDLPMGVSDRIILDYLKMQPGVSDDKDWDYSRSST